MSTSTDQLWLVAEQEADNAEERNPGLWARCFAQAEGDASKAKALYMTERVRQLGGTAATKQTTQIHEMGWPAKLGLILLVLLIGFFALAALLPDNGSADKRAAIDMCWKDQKNPALDPSTQRFVASTCQVMEREYKQQYGSEP
ncbi:hypothetical protein ACSLNH_05245 [Comamonas kerstersii]|uniref:hypothetical protein n=1 Tax=Comamonas kerstersii TaxID=225992 RepID=UPI001271C23A|nr:hypothetical protein [Salmonella enterica subsp. enterica serovar Dublin]